ncbi:unnamed protein product [Arctogadus glacialis]
MEQHGSGQRDLGNTGEPNVWKLMEDARPPSAPAAQRGRVVFHRNLNVWETIGCNTRCHAAAGLPDQEACAVSNSGPAAPRGPNPNDRPPPHRDTPCPPPGKSISPSAADGGESS